ncbi:MAG: 30S ribosomal protein S1 [Thermodesulfobacteriota bacterium]|nr:30S ribosomal protein S1 [Thermodesulfobacteriota bacterium]
MVNENNLISNHEELSKEVETENKEGEQPVKKQEDLGFKELFEQNLQNVQIGEVVTGRVVQINDDVVMVDVGWKTEGRVPTGELKDDNGNIVVAVDDEIEIFIDRRGTDGDLMLSMEKAARMKIWDDIIKACEGNGTMEGTVLERVKGGLSVDIGIPAFLPGSQVDIRPVKNLDRFVGKTLKFDVLKYDRKRNNIVLSRRSVLEREREEEKKKTLETMEEGKIVEGIIKNITDYGLFIDLGGIDGLLHVTDISWGRITRPSTNFSKGDRITVTVLSFDREKERVTLGLKQLAENPWDTITEKYPIGSIVEGKIVNIMDYGAFVELEQGVEGLVHISEIFWTREIKHPSKILSPGEIAKVMVLDVNHEDKRISLSLKQTSENPWMILKEKYPEGSTVKGTVRNITNFGIFIGVEEGIDGLVHISDISWKHRVKHPSEFFKKGQEVEAVVLNIDVENEKFSLGIKQIEKNPWDEIGSKYSPGSVISGKVTNVTDFGIFVEIEEGIEGLVHISELSNKRIKSSSDLFAIGDDVSAVVINVDPENRKMRLSIKDHESSSNKSSTSEYLNNSKNVTSSLGKALSEINFPVLKV